MKAIALLAIMALAFASAAYYHAGYSSYSTPTPTPYTQTTYAPTTRMGYAPPQYLPPVPYPYYSPSESSTYPRGFSQPSYPLGQYSYPPQSTQTIILVRISPTQFPPWLGGLNYWYDLPDEESRFLGPSTSSSTFPPSFIPGYYSSQQNYYSQAQYTPPTQTYAAQSQPQSQYSYYS